MRAAFDTKTAFPELTTIGRLHRCERRSDTKTAFPKLTTIGRLSLCEWQLTQKTAFPELTTIGELSRCERRGHKDGVPETDDHRWLSLCERRAQHKDGVPGTDDHRGYLYAGGADTKTAFPKLTTIGRLSLCEWRKLTQRQRSRKLTTIGRLSLCGRRRHKDSVPETDDHRGLSLCGRQRHKDSVPKTSATIEGSLYVGGLADTKTAFPKLTNQNDPNASAICRRNIFQENLKIGYYFVDGILARLINHRGHVARVVIRGKTAVSYVS